MNKVIKKPLLGYEEFYEISSDGKIFSFDRKITYPCGRIEIRKAREIKQVVNYSNGYCYIGLTDNNKKQKIFRVHRLVAINFIDNPNDLPEVNHINYIKTLNCKENLEWCDKYYNQQHSARKPNRKWGLAGVRKTGNDNNKSKSINVFTIDGDFVKKYESGNLASIDLNCCQSKISQCCLGKIKSHKGYIFKFNGD
jgi:hypothetical protein